MFLDCHILPTLSYPLEKCNGSKAWMSAIVMVTYMFALLVMI